MALGLATALGPAVAVAAPAPALALAPCWLKGMASQALCGTLSRPLDPARPDGPHIDIHVAVLPSLARRKLPDPIFILAGGPGQSAIDLAGPMDRLLARLNNRRDIVLVDQRGTGRSAPLKCEMPGPEAPLAQASMAQQLQALRRCRDALAALPHVGQASHLGLFTTSIAMADLDAVREALKVPRINLVGASYGTRAVLEYMRRFPAQVRRAVMDGVAPPDMVLPQAFSLDNQAALEKVFAACEAEPACRARHPQLRAQWAGLLASLPRSVVAAHPFTGEPQRFTLERETLLALVRSPLYSPGLASGLPAAIELASRGRFEPLLGLSSALAGRKGELGIAQGMHFSVVCTEDGPRLDADAPQGADFAGGFANFYRQVCGFWPRGAVPNGFYTVPPAPVASLLLSGGADPATPPRHAQRVAESLGPKARHLVVKEAGHGLLGLPCMREVLQRFIDAPDDEAALEAGADCGAEVPRPPAFALPRNGGTP